MAEVDGRSRVPEILAAARGEPAPEDAAAAYAHLDRTWGRRVRQPAPTVAVVEGGFRYVMARDERGETRGELFDGSRDPREGSDVLAAEPEVAERLRVLAESYLEREPPWDSPAPTLELDEMQLNQLRALGYKVP
jgi:hypothetical protein